MSTSILDILNNLVCRNHLFSFLEVDDLLRLRRVSRSFQNEAKDFIRTKKLRTKCRICVDFGESDLNQARNKSRNHVRDLRWMNDLANRNDLPIKTGAIFDFPGKSAFLSISTRFQYFLDHFTSGSSITHLYFVRLQLPVSFAGMYNFFDLFPNVAHLRIVNIVSGTESEIPSTSSAKGQKVKIPSTLTKLKSLKIFGFLVDESPSVTVTQNAFDFIANLVETSLPSLEELELPYNCFQYWGVPMGKLVGMARKCLLSAPLLKWNVHREFIEYLLQPDNRAPEMPSLASMISIINAKVISIKDPRYNSFLLELPNLEDITIYGGWTSWIPELDDSFRREWPKLKKIFVSLHDHGNVYLDPNLFKVWNFLFGGGIQRKNVAKLAIIFDGFKKENIRQGNQSLARAMELITSCPSLKILKLEGKVQQLVNLQKLWKGLPLLEELTFRYVNDLKDSDFIGDDHRAPTFWDLKNLTVLELRDLKYTHVTDDLLSKVLCHMPLKKLTLSSFSLSNRKHSITSSGIRSLLNGQFASTIELLDITELNLGSAVSTTEKEKLGSLFRSSQMI